MKLLIGSNNAGKVEQCRRQLINLPVQLVTPKEVGVSQQPEETGATYAQNARIKAQFFYKQSGLPTFADDSGIEVDALKGELGVKSRRWGAGANVSDEEWITFFFKRMEKESNRAARFISTICYIDAHGEEYIFTGSCEGTVLQVIKAPYPKGLPLSGCFMPIGYDRVYTELTTTEEAAINHRGKALQQLHTFLTTEL